MTDLDTIRERHYAFPKTGTTQTRQSCPWCGQSWPCDTRVVLDAWDADMDDTMVKTGRIAGNMSLRLEAAAAHAKALAEALRQAADVAHRSQHDHNTSREKCRSGDHPGTGTRCGDWTEALAAYDKEHKR